MKLIIATLTAATVVASSASALVQPTYVENRDAAQNALSKFKDVAIGEVLALGGTFSRADMQGAAPEESGGIAHAGARPQDAKPTR